jgi:hypothetical protein
MAFDRLSRSRRNATDAATIIMTAIAPRPEPPSIPGVPMSRPIPPGYGSMEVRLDLEDNV